MSKKRNHEIHDSWLLEKISEAITKIGSKSYPIHVIKILEKMGYSTMCSLEVLVNDCLPESMKDNEEKIEEFVRNNKDFYKIFALSPGCGEKTAEIIIEVCASMAKDLVIYKEEPEMMEDQPIRDLIPDLYLEEIPEKCPVDDEDMTYYAVRCGDKSFFSLEEKNRYSIQRWLVKEGEFYTLKMNRNWYDAEVAIMRLKLFCQFGARLFKVQK